MADIKWIKLSVGMFDDEKIRLIEKMPEADTIIVIWVKLLALAGRSNLGGYIMLTESIPYTEDMLLAVIDRPIATIRMALAAFERFGMIEMSENGAYFLTNWEKHQNVDGMERVREQTRKRVEEYRKRQKNLNLGNATSNVTVTDGNGTELDKELDKDSCCYIPTPDGVSYTKDEGIPPSRQDAAPVTPETGADSIQEQISSLDVDYRQAVAGKYLMRRGKGLEITKADEAVIDELVKESIPLQTALDGIDQSFDKFKPKHKRDEIRSLSYCATIIYSLHAARVTDDDKSESSSKDAVPEIPVQSKYSEDDVQKMLEQLKAKREE